MCKNKEPVHYLDYFFIFVITLLYTFSYLDSNLYIDTARDLHKVGQIVNAEHFILQGPSLAGAIHLGPWWFYWLSLAGLFSSIKIIALWVGISSGLKFILAYSLTRKVVNRLFALCVVFAMLLPGWHSFEQFTFTNTNLVPTLTYLFLLLLWNLWNSKQGSRLKWIVLVYSLAVHSHPSTFGLLLFASPFLIKLLTENCFSKKDIGWAICLGILTLAPYFVQQYLNNWVDINTVNNFSEDHFSISRIALLPNLLGSLFYTGPILHMDMFFSYFGRAKSILQGGYWALLILSLCGYLYGVMRQRVNVKIVLTLFWAIISLSICILFVRNRTPVYMVFVLQPIVAMIIGYGLYQIISSYKAAKRPTDSAAEQIAGNEQMPVLKSSVNTAARKSENRAINNILVPILVVIGIISIGITWKGIAESSIYNKFIIPEKQLFNVISEFDQNWRNKSYLQIALPSIRQAVDVGDYLCKNKHRQLHGPMIPILDLTFGAITQFKCKSNELLINGNYSGYALLSPLAYQPLEKAGFLFKTIGNYAIINSVTPLKPVKFTFQKVNDYYTNSTTKTIKSHDNIVIKKELSSDKLVMITSYFGIFTNFAKPNVTINGKTMAPLVTGRYMYIYHCTQCSDNTYWEINLNNVEQNAIDIVSFVLERSNY